MSARARVRDEIEIPCIEFTYFLSGRSFLSAAFDGYEIIAARVREHFSSAFRTAAATQQLSPSSR